MVLLIFTSAREVLRTASEKWHPASAEDAQDAPSRPCSGSRHVSGRLSLVIRPARMRYGDHGPMYRD